MKIIDFKHRKTHYTNKLQCYGNSFKKKNKCYLLVFIRVSIQFLQLIFILDNILHTQINYVDEPYCEIRRPDVFEKILLFSRASVEFPGNSSIEFVSNLIQYFSKVFSILLRPTIYSAQHVPI